MANCEVFKSTIIHSYNKSFVMSLVFVGIFFIFQDPSYSVCTAILSILCCFLGGNSLRTVLKRNQIKIQPKLQNCN